MRFAKRNGKRVAVIRPSAPALALQLAHLAVKTNDGELFDQLPEKVGEYTFMGWLSQGRRPCILNEREETAGEIVAGDSFVDPDCLTTERPR